MNPTDVSRSVISVITGVAVLVNAIAVVLNLTGENTNVYMAVANSIAMAVSAACYIYLATDGERRGR